MISSRGRLLWWMGGLSLRRSCGGGEVGGGRSGEEWGAVGDVDVEIVWRGRHPAEI